MLRFLIFDGWESELSLRQPTKRKLSGNPIIGIISCLQRVSRV